MLIRSSPLVSALQAAGVLFNKSSILKFPGEDIVPQELIIDFIRGYFDGDGCFTYHIDKNNKVHAAIKICGTEDMCVHIDSLLSAKPHKLYKRHESSVNNYCLDIGGTKQVIRIMSRLYENASRFLERKRDKFNEFTQLYYSRPHR